MTVALMLLFYKYDGLGDGGLLSGIGHRRHWSHCWVCPSTFRIHMTQDGGEHSLRVVGLLGAKVGRV